MALPGVTTILKDRFYTVSRTDAPTGPRVLALATRDTADGTADASGNVVANFDPYTPRSEQDCIAAFGEGSGAHRAYLELVAGGGSDVSIVALPSGTTDSNLASTANGNVLDQAFEAAETARPDIIVGWGRGGHSTDWEVTATPGNDLQVGFHADNSSSFSTSMAKRFAEKCKELTDRSHPTFGVLGVKPFIGTGANATENMLAANVSTHTSFSTLADHEATGMGDWGAYVSVVAAELNPTTYPQHSSGNRRLAGAFGYSNGAGLYAGQLSTLDPQISATGKQLFNVAGVRYNPTRPQQEAMIADGLVPVALDFGQIPVWVDALTFGRSTSDYTRLSTIRIVFTAMLGVRQAAQSFIGSPATLHNRNALETAISSVLRRMTQSGALFDSDFVVTYIPRMNKAIVDLVLRPAFELRNIEVQISVDL